MRRKKEELLFDHTGQVSVEDMRDYREQEPTGYVAPHAGDKMRAVYALSLADISNGAKAIGSALIWHANSVTGRCDPGLQRLAFETGRCRQTVINAIAELRRKRVLKRQRRGQSTNAYHLNWSFLATKFQEFETRVTSVRFLRQGHPRTEQEYKNLDLGSTEPCTSEVQNLVPEPMKRTHELNSLPEWAHPPSAADAYDDFLENHFDGVTQLPSAPVERPKGFQERTHSA